VRHEVFVPPGRAGAKGTLGRDYFISEEHVALSVLEDISTLEEVSDFFAENAHYFMAILPILDRAVTENIEYKYARRDGSISPNDANGRSSRGGARSCNFQSFGVDWALMDDPYELSEDDIYGDEKSTTGDENKDECDICGDGGELLCCDNCDKAYHANCLRVEPDSLPDPWHCPSCLNNGNDNKKMAALSHEQTQTAPASDNAISDDNEIASNLSEVEPKVNMPIEILDSDLIWNMGKIVLVSFATDTDQNGTNASSPKCYVTIRYEGWGPEWDERLPYPNERLARIFTYTKKAKCFVAMLGSKKHPGSCNGAGNEESRTLISNWTDAWPCAASFRMPHPNQNQSSDAFELRKESCRIFVHPYMAHLLPREVRRQMAYGGQWVSEDKLRPWKDLDVINPVTSTTGDSILYELPSGGPSGEKTPALSAVGISYYFVHDFCRAYQMAQSDWIKGCLPPNALLEGALLKDEYRVCNVGGDVIDGARHSGSFPMKKKGGKYSQGSLITSVAQYNLNSGSDVNCLSKLEDSPHLPPSKVPFVPAPSLPPPIPITDIAYPDQGVRRLPDSNRWASILRVAGNEIFLGSYTSQSEAAYAVKLASAQSKTVIRQDMAGTTKGSGRTKSTLHLPHFPNFQEDAPFASNKGKIADLLNTPIESIVSAFEETQSTSSQKEPSQPRFRLHDWMAQHYRHVQHLKDLAPMSGQDVSNDFSFIVNVKNNENVGHKRRKKSVPKRLRSLTPPGKQNNNNLSGTPSNRPRTAITNEQKSKQNCKYGASAEEKAFEVPSRHMSIDAFGCNVKYSAHSEEPKVSIKEEYRF